MLSKEENFHLQEFLFNKHKLWRSKLAYYIFIFLSGFTNVPVEARLKIKFRVKEFENGKITNRKLVSNVSEGFTPFKLSRF